MLVPRRTWAGAVRACDSTLDASARVKGLGDLSIRRASRTSHLWESAWVKFVPFLIFDVEIRRVVCTTTAIESINARICRAVRARGRFPDERAAASATCTLTGTYLVGYVSVMDAVLHALSDESRRTMLEMLRDHPATVNELAAALPIARPGVSRHLRVLREAGLVDVRQEAQWRTYSLRLEPLAELDEWLGRYRALWERRMGDLHAEIARGKQQRKAEQ